MLNFERYSRKLAKRCKALFLDCGMNGKDIFSTLTPPSAAEESLHYWNGLRSGKSESFTALYYQHIDALYHYGERLTADKTLIEDCVQDLFADLWTRRKTLPEVLTVKFYLFKALKRTIRRKQRQQARLLSEASVGHDFALTLTAELDNEELLFSPAQKTALLQAVNQLTPRQKEAITLRFYDNFSYDEIAEIMDLSDRSVYNLMYRALAVLRQRVDVGLWQRVLLALLLIQ